MGSYSLPSVDTAGSMTLLSNTPLSGASTTLSNLPTNFTKLVLNFSGLSNATASGQWRVDFNNASNIFSGSRLDGSTGGTLASTRPLTANNWTYTNALNSVNMEVSSTNNASTGLYPVLVNGVYNSTNGILMSGFLNAGAGVALSSVVISNSGGAWNGGTVKLYGVK
jgi:hypothetical protein